MDAIECGIVKLPRVPGGREHPGQRDADVPEPVGAHPQGHAQEGPRQGEGPRPAEAPHPLKTALEALYGHYEKTFELWEKEGIEVPPCFIIVCNNTATSKLVYDYVSGFERLERRRWRESSTAARAVPQLRRVRQPAAPAQHAPDRQRAARVRRRPGRELPGHGRRRDRALPPGDRRAHRRRARPREDLRPGPAPGGHEHGRQGGPARRADPLRRLGVHAHRGLGRQHRHPRPRRARLRDPAPVRAGHRPGPAPPVLRPERGGLFNVEYADVLGIPFDFTAKPVVAPPQPPRQTVTCKAVRPDRDHLEIRFPRVQGYRVELPEERLEASFTEDSTWSSPPTSWAHPSRATPASSARA
jgi:type III restriction enzyme